MNLRLEQSLISIFVGSANDKNMVMALMSDDTTFSLLIIDSRASISLAAHKIIRWLFHCCYRRGMLRSASQVFFASSTSEKISHRQIDAVSVLGLALDGTDLAGGSLVLCPPGVGYPLPGLKHHGW